MEEDLERLYLEHRQGLFTLADARSRAYKSQAAQAALARLFPRASLSAEVRRVGSDFRDRLAGVDPKHGTLFGAADIRRERFVAGW